MKVDNDNFINQLRMKNEDALMYVIDEYGGLIKAVIRKNMSCLQSKQDECFNDVLLSIWEHIESFHEDSQHPRCKQSSIRLVCAENGGGLARNRNNNFKNWISAIAKYKSIDYMRKHRYEADKIAYSEMENYDLPIEDRMEMLDNEISARTEELLSVLKPEDREILIRIYAHEEPVEQVSQELNLKKSVIYNRISRAKKKLRTQKGV